MKTNISSLIDIYFIQALVNAKLYAEPAEGLSDAIAGRVSGVTPDGLTAATMRIISNRKSGTFPKVPECVDAIKSTQFAQPQQSGSGFSGEITKQTYFEQALSHARRAPLIAISAAAQPSQWEAWCEYFGYLGLNFSHKAMRSGIAQNFTVPTPWPEHFDRNYRPAKKQQEAA